MAQALYERLGGSARSAGSNPAAAVHPSVVDAMREIGVDVSARTPRALDRADVEWADVVVTMGCGDACPYIPGKRYVEWDLPDPADASVEEVWRLRDEVARLVAGLA